MQLWQPGDPITGEGMRFLVGIAVWSVYDLRLLDSLKEALLKDFTRGQVDVFDVDRCLTQVDLHKYLQNTEKMLRTPMAGVWENGQKVKDVCGYDAVQMLVAHFKLRYSPHDVV